MNTVRNVKGESPYFQGRYNQYGRYCWNVKYYGFESSEEIQAAVWAFLGDHVMLSRSRNGGKHQRGFEFLNELLERPVEAYLDGRSGGWLAIHDELTEAELAKVDAFVSDMLKSLPGFLAEERELRAAEAAEAERAEQAIEQALKADARVIEALRLINEVAGCDAVVMIKGIQLK